MALQILHILFILLFIYLSCVTVYFLVAAIAGRLVSLPVYSSNKTRKKIAILIPSYREDNVITQTARSARDHNYPAELFDVFIASDQLQPETVDALKRIPVSVSEVHFEIGTKAKSLNYLLNAIDEHHYDIALILDADNILMPGCLDMINDAFVKGYRAVQAHRIAKNRNTPIAILDAISEEVNNHLFRKSQRALGLSASTIGSGMAFEFKKLKEIYNKPGILENPACDREVDYEIMKGNIVIEYVDKAFVLDEKVSSKKHYEQQRTRWLESQIRHLRLFFSAKDAVALKTKNYWNKLFTNLIPPRLLILLFYLLILVLYIIQSILEVHILAPAPLWWLLLFAGNFVTILISIPAYLFTKETAKAFLHIPALVISMLKALFRMKPSRKEFLHTPKTFVKDSGIQKD